MVDVLLVICFLWKRGELGSLGMDKRDLGSWEGTGRALGFGEPLRIRCKYPASGVPRRV